MTIEPPVPITPVAAERVAREPGCLLYGEKSCAFCGEAFTPQQRKQMYCRPLCYRRSKRKRERKPARQREDDEADILAPAHCGWCGRGLPEEKTHCSADHKRRHEAAAAELAASLEQHSPKDASGRSERSARRSA